MDKPNAAYSGHQARYLSLKVTFILCLNSYGIFLGSSGGLPKSISLSPEVETETGSLFLGLCVRHAVPT